MRKRTFGKTGLSVTPLGFGAGPIGYVPTEQERIARTLNLLLDRGVNVIDTAAMYPGSEEAIGKAVGHRRSEYVLISKCGQAFDDLPGKAWSAEVVTATVDRALRRLRTDHLDVMLLHTCDLDVLQAGDAVGALVRAREAGKIRFAGYSGDNETAAYATTLPDIAVIETSISVFDQANIAHVLPLTQKEDIGVLAKRPIGNSAWKVPEDQPTIYKDYAREYHARFQKMGLRPEDLGGTDWASIALQFTVAQPGVHTAIVGTTNPDNALRNIDVIEGPGLAAETIAKLREAFQKAEKASGETWPGLR